MLDWSNLNSVQELKDDIIIVGEAHKSKRSEELVRQIIEDKEPDIIAIEHSPSALYNFPPESKGGINEAVRYASYTESPVVYIDQGIQWLKANLENKAADVSNIANSLQHEITDIGDVKESTISNVRNRVRDVFGENDYRHIYTIREQKMAKRLLKTRETMDGRILAVVGAYHILALPKFMQTCESCDVSDKRVNRVASVKKWKSQDGQIVTPTKCLSISSALK